MRQRILGGIILTLSIATADAALLGRAPVTPGGSDYQAYYDDALGITWLTNANLAATNSFGLPVVPPPGPGFPFNPGPGEVTTRGQMRFDTAATWLALMNSADYLARSDWRLPSIAELAYQLSNNGVVPQPGPCLPNPICFGGPFVNIAGDYYWSGTDSLSGPGGAQVFYFPMNETASFSKDSAVGLFVWPVVNGDIGVVPIPAAVWLLGSALGVLGWIRRKAGIPA